MKKFILIMVMMFGMSIYSFADDSNATKVDNIERYEFKISHRRLACVLDMSLDQMEMSESIWNQFSNEMSLAATINNEEARNESVSEAVKRNVKYMRYVLNDKQYRKYLTLFNLTLQNRGFDISKICQ